VLNNLKGVLIGISHFATNNVQANQDKLEIKIWAGGSAPTTIKEIIAQRLDSTTPAIVLNDRVNYINNDRLYFSADITISSSYTIKGLFSIGQSDAGEWVLNFERESPDGTSVLAAAGNADFVAMVYGSVGQLAHTRGGGIYTTSYYESVINPKMPLADTFRKKELKGIFATYLPLISGAQIQVQYRVDSDQEGTWVNVITDAVDGSVYSDAVRAGGDILQVGFMYEFRVISTGGAVLTGFGYDYDFVKTQIR
jgi:hypothetical protein